MQIKNLAPLQLFNFGMVLGSIAKVQDILKEFNISTKLSAKIENLMRHLAEMVYEK